MKKLATILCLTCVPGLALANPGARPTRAARAPQYKDITVHDGNVAPAEHAPLRAQGLMRNVVSARFGASTHIPNASFASDTVVVVAQGSAYQGKGVSVGGESFQNAAVVYLQKQAGMSHQGEFHVLGQAGEEVRLFEMRIDDTTPATARGLDRLQANGGGFWGGDPHWRNLKIKIATSPADGSAAPIEGYQRDQLSPAMCGYPEAKPETGWSQGNLWFHDTGNPYAGH